MKTRIVLTRATLITASGTAFAGNCAWNKSGMSTAYTVMPGHGQAAPAIVRTGGYGNYGSGHTMTQAKPDIVDTAVSAGQFSTLVKAVQAAGLVDTLKGDGPFTVFAPTDAAFAKLPAGTLEALLADPEKLAQILKYHVVPGKLDARKVMGMSQLATVEGSPLPVDSISIASTDIMTSNGVIHVIDEVLVPQS
jgi:uncharacterized surface protein with fasciclin (FAS1) repeats